MNRANQVSASEPMIAPSSIPGSVSSSFRPILPSPPNSSSSSTTNPSSLPSSSSSSSSSNPKKSSSHRNMRHHNAVFLSYDDIPDLWMEPEIAQLAPSSTGYPLDAPPPQKLLPKVKKPNAHHRGRKQQGSGSNGSSSNGVAPIQLPDAPSSADKAAPFKSFALPPNTLNNSIASTDLNNSGDPDSENSELYEYQQYIPFSLKVGVENPSWSSSESNNSSIPATNTTTNITPSNTNPQPPPKSNPADLDSTSLPVSTSPTPSANSHGNVQASSSDLASNDVTSSPPPVSSTFPSNLYKNYISSRRSQLIVKLKTNLTENLTNGSYVRSSAKSDPSAPKYNTTKALSVQDLEDADNNKNKSSSQSQATTTAPSDQNKNQNAINNYFPPSQSSPTSDISTHQIQNSIITDNNQLTNNTTTHDSDLNANPEDSTDLNLSTATPPPGLSIEDGSGIHNTHSDVDLNMLSSPIKRQAEDIFKGKRSNKRRKNANDERITPDHPNTIHTRTRQHHEIDEAAANDDFCATCHGAGRFLCCEGCPKSFHFSCVDPPLDESMLPEGAWFCKECVAKQNPPKQYKRGLFSQLLYQLDRRNPIQFVLPKKIRTRFEGVSSNELGEYMDSDTKVFKGTRSGFVEEDPYRLTDKNGNPIFCYKCKKSSLSGGPIARCDYCSLNWHLDCLNPPLPTVKTIGTKWKCPNHADHAYKKKRKPKTAKIQDTALRRGFKNDGNIEVLNSSDEELNEQFARNVPLNDYYDTPTGISAPVPSSILKPITQNGVIYRIPERGVKLDFIQAVHERNAEPYQDTHNSDILLALDELATREKDVREGVRNLCYLQAKDGPDEATALARKHLEILIDAALGNSNDLGELLVKDASSGSGNTRSSSGGESGSLSGSMLRKATGSRRASQIANNKIHAAAEEGRYNTRRTGSGLRNEISSSPEPPASRVSSRLRSGGSSSSSNDDRNSNSGNYDFSVTLDGYMSPEERTHLIAIQKLIKLRGKDALMDFLLPRADI